MYMYVIIVGHTEKVWRAQNEARGQEEAEGGRGRGAPETVNFPRWTVNFDVGSQASQITVRGSNVTKN